MTAYESVLDRSERILNDFFTKAYADIKDVYERRYEKKEISYKLYLKKMIGGKLPRTILIC